MKPSPSSFDKIRTLEMLYSILPEDQLIITDVLREIIIQALPPYCKEKISFQVPYFYGHKGICFVWPATIPRGGIKKGVLLGLWYGCMLKDRYRYLTQGTNKQIFYKVITEVDQVNEKAIRQLLKEAVKVDEGWK